MYYIISGKYRKLKNPKMSYIFEKALVLTAVSVRKYMKKYLKKKNQLRY